MIWAFLLVNVWAVMAAVYLRYQGSDLAHAAPVALSGQQWLWALGLLAGLTLAIGAAAAKALCRRECRRPLLELLAVFLLLFAYEWSFYPPYRKRAIDWIVIAVFVAVLVVLFWLDRANLREWGVTGQHFVRAARALAIPTGVMVALPIVGAVFVGTDFRPGRAALAVVSYPFYALLQLLLFQVFLVRRLRRLSGSSISVVIVAAGMFAMLHWPNALVMAACGAAACVWTVVYLKSPDLCAISLSMALAATAFTHALPHSVTHHVRVGPIYVQRLVERKGRPTSPRPPRQAAPPTSVTRSVPQ